jgi:acyl-CoA thioesterase I
MHTANTKALIPFLENLRADRHQLMVAIGDSNTNNTNFTDGAKQWPELLHSRLKDACSTQKLLLVNAGVSGDTIHGALERFEQHVARFKPNLVILCFGSNDANRATDDAFRSDLETCLDRISAAGSLVLLRTPTPIVEMEPRPPHLWQADTALQTKVAVIQAIARERKLPFVDIYQLWKDEERQQTLACVPLFGDAVPTNAAGPRRVYEDLLPAFGIAE